ncbi:hypothetical protein [Parafrankia sp. EUN1f]|nr:hypothetical protein [Parafrankia sp. EUN1f]
MAIELGLVSADISVKLKASEFRRTEFDFAPPPDVDHLHDVDGAVGA